MCDIRLFRSAYTDFELAREIFQIPRNDEAFLNGIAYHLQQSVEKLLKAFLECKGVTVSNPHDIYKLVRMSRQNGSNIVLTSWLEDRADTLTCWETDTRYNIDYSVEAQKVQEGIEEIRVLFEMNGIVIIRSTESSWKKNKMIYDTEEIYGRICNTRGR